MIEFLILLFGETWNNRKKFLTMKLISLHTAILRETAKNENFVLIVSVLNTLMET